MEAIYSFGMADNISRTLPAAVPLINQLTPPQSKYRGHQPPQKWSAEWWRSRISWWNGGNRQGRYLKYRLSGKAGSEVISCDVSAIYLTCRSLGAFDYSQGAQNKNLPIMRLWEAKTEIPASSVRPSSPETEERQR